MPDARSINKVAKDGNSQAVANTAWAFATLGHDCPNLLDEIEKHVDWLAKNGSSQAVANVITAFSKSGREPPSELTVIHPNLKAE